MIWQDALHQYVGIVHRPQKLTALHAVTKAEAIYSSYSPSYPSYSGSSSYSNSGSSSKSSESSRPRWSRSGSSLLYTVEQVQSHTPIRNAIETRAALQPELRDVFLCHA